MAGKYAPAELNDIEAAFENVKGQKRSISKSAIYTEIERYTQCNSWLSQIVSSSCYSPQLTGFV